MNNRCSPCRRSPPIFREDSTQRYSYPRFVDFRIPNRQVVNLNVKQRQALCSLWWQVPLDTAKQAWRLLKMFASINRNPNWPQCGFDAERQEKLERARMILRNEGIAIPL